MGKNIDFIRENWKIIKQVAEEEAQPIIDSIHGKKKKKVENVGEDHR